MTTMVTTQVRRRLAVTKKRWGRALPVSTDADAANGELVVAVVTAHDTRVYADVDAAIGALVAAVPTALVTNDGIGALATALGERGRSWRRSRRRLLRIAGNHGGPPSWPRTLVAAVPMAHTDIEGGDRGVGSLSSREGFGARPLSSREQIRARGSTTLMRTR